MRRLFTLLVPAVVLLMALALITGCTDKPTDSISPGQKNVALKASVSTPDYLQLVDVFVLTVTARDMDPIVDTLYFDGRYITGEIDVPAGDGRLFVLEGIQFAPNSAPPFRTIYRGQALVNVRPNAVTPLPIEMIPVVPMVKLSPLVTTVQSGSTFSVDLKIYHVPTLVALFVWIDFDDTMVNPEGAVRSTSLDPSIIFRANRANTDAPLYEVYVSDTLRRGIVDSDGYANLGTITFGTSGVIGEPVSSFLTFNLVVTTVQYPDSVGTLQGVYREESQVTLLPLTDRAVSFADQILEDEVRYQASLYDTTVYGRQLMLSDVLPITYLSVVERGVSNLSGIENLVNLQSLNLDYCNVSNFTPLAALNNLRYLEVQGNSLGDLSTLASVKGLEYLDLSFNDITDITPLAQLTALQALDLGFNYDLVNIGPLANLKNLNYLNLQYNTISDISPVAGLSRLQSLYLGHNPLVNIGALQGLLRLSYVDLNNCQIIDILPLVINSRNGGLGQYNTVDLTGNPLNQATWPTYIAELEKNGVTVIYPR